MKRNFGRRANLSQATGNGWTTYCIGNRRAVAKIVGPGTLTVNHPLRRDADWTPQ